jgi:DNA-binding transcriptional ArsR family regulator
MPQLAQVTSEFFKSLAHPLRIRILESLRGGEIGVNDLSSRLDVEQSTLSQQLAVLRKSNIVVGRKDGLHVFYSVSDPAVFRLLDEARQLFKGHFADLLSQLNHKGRNR